MKKKLIGIIVCMLLIAAAVLPVAGTENYNTTKLENQLLGTTEQGSTTSDDDWWPMFRHDPGNTGCSSSLAPNMNQLSWQQNIWDNIYSAVPIVVDDKLYISTNWYYDTIEPPSPPEITKTLISDEKPSLCKTLKDIITTNKEYYGGIYCLDADTGVPLWNYQMLAPNDPAVIDGKVYVTDSGIYSYYSSLYCLDASTGSMIWQKPMNDWVVSSTIVYDEKIYLGCLDYYSFSGTLECLDINGNDIWTYTLPPNESILFTAPAVCDGRVYFIAMDLYSYYFSNLYCLDAETGQYLWSQPLFSWWYFGFDSSPVCNDGKVYVSDLDLYSYFGYLKCFDAVTGSQLWSYNIGWSFSTPAVCDDSVFATAFDLFSYYSWIYRIDATTGTLIWKAILPVSAYFFSSGSPVVADNKIYVSPSDYYYTSNELFCLDADNGGLIWSYTFGYPTLSSPSIADGRVYMADWMGNIYAFGYRNEPPSTPYIDGPSNGAAGKPYDYTFKSTDPDGDDVYYFIYWGDGTMEIWNGPNPSGEEITLSHTWDEKGTYNISAKAKDIYNSQSDWGVLEVTMPLIKISGDSTIDQIFEKLAQRFPLLARIYYFIRPYGNIFLVQES